MKALLALALLAAAPLLRAAPAGPAEEPDADGVEPPSLSSSARSLSLEEAYKLALERSERLAQAKELPVQLEAQLDALWGSVKPRVTLAPSELLQDGGGTGLNQSSRLVVPVSVHQPIFSGFREYLAAKSLEAQGKASALQVERTRHLLYQDVAEACYTLWALQRQFEVQLELDKTTRSRLKDLRQFVRLGRSRKSEILASQAQLALIEAQIEGLRGSERVAQRGLAFLTGLAEDAAPAGPPPAEPLPLEGYLERSRGRPDIAAQREALRSRDLDLEIARRGNWPVIAADGNYYLKRTGFQSPVKWDLLLSLQLPLYTGGSLAAQTRERESQRRSAEEGLSLALRGAEREVRGAHERLLAARAAEAALRKAAGLAEANAKAQSADYKLGLVTNFETLNALVTLQQTRLSLVQAQLNAALARVELEVAAGPSGL